MPLFIKFCATVFNHLECTVYPSFSTSPSQTPTLQHWSAKASSIYSSSLVSQRQEPWKHSNLPLCAILLLPYIFHLILRCGYFNSNDATFPTHSRLLQSAAWNIQIPNKPLPAPLPQTGGSVPRVLPNDFRGTSANHHALQLYFKIPEHSYIKEARWLLHLLIFVFVLP